MRVCPLCGLRFYEAEAKRPCRGCPLDSNCRLICCPNCGYQMPEEPRWLIRFKHWWQDRKRPQSSACAPVQTATLMLSALKPGQVAEIVQVCPPDNTTLCKLKALGLLPGTRLVLLRRFPCYLLQIGHAQLALDRRLASAILVRAD